MSRSLLRLLSIVFLVLYSTVAFAHDSWISRGGLKNQAGEWCCGAEDCGVVSPSAVRAMRGGYSVVGTVTYGTAATGNATTGSASAQ